MTRNEPSQWEHDVFVSFTPDEETKAFIKDLFNWLNQVGISYFRVGEEEGVTEGNKAVRINAISPRRCAIAVVVFSENYLEEPCLRELKKILKSGTDHRLVVIPIYPAGDTRYDNWRSRLVAKNISGYEWSNLTAPCALADGKSKPIDIIAERLLKEIHSLYPVKVFGPFGGEAEEPWNFTYEFNEIKGIDVKYGWSATDRNGPFIKSITFKANTADTRPVTTYVGDGRQDTYEVKLEVGEYISSFAGYFEDANVKKIKSLTFRTNKRTLGPIGEEEGVYFSVPSKAGKVTKIFGRSNEDFLESIGADVELQSAFKESDPIQSAELFVKKSSYWNDGNQYNNVRKIIFELDSSRNRFIQSIEFQYVEKDGELEKYGSNPVQQVKSYTIKSEGPDRYLTSMSKSIGPFGGENAWDDGKFNGVKEIYLSDNLDIRYIRFVYDNGSKEVHTAHPRGVSHNNMKEKIILDYPREYLTSISGYKQKNGSISSLIFHSNKKRYPYGKKTDEYFCSPSTRSRIVGFYGTWGETLNSIGVHVEPIPYMRPFEIVKPIIEDSDGTPWDDGVHANVIAFRVTASGHKKCRKIESITFMYDNNGSCVEGSRHGGGDAGDWVKLEFPKERLTFIEGHSTREDGKPGETIIQDLRIYTTEKHYGPYAPRANLKNAEPKFTIPEESRDGRIVGFFGKAGTHHLNSIGARLEPY